MGLRQNHNTFRWIQHASNWPPQLLLNTPQYQKLHILQWLQNLRVVHTWTTINNVRAKSLPMEEGPRRASGNGSRSGDSGVPGVWWSSGRSSRSSRGKIFDRSKCGRSMISRDGNYMSSGSFRNRSSGGGIFIRFWDGRPMSSKISKSMNSSSRASWCDQFLCHMRPSYSTIIV